jgi:hypothetical protein
MAAEEDKKFDAVLGGFLVHDLRARAGNLHCPEADVLAAYHERTLLPEEMNSWKEHIAGCARCQAVLAELQATDSIPLRVSQKEEASPAAQPATVPTPEESARPAKAPEKPRVTSIPRRVRWQWLVPAGALAAGLLIWVAWHENRSPVKAPAEVKTARMEPPPPPVPGSARQDETPASQSLVEKLMSSKEQSTVGAAGSVRTSPEAKRLKQFETKDSRGRVIPSEPRMDKEIGARAEAALDSLAAANDAQNRLPQGAKAGVASETVELPKPTANTAAQNQQAQQNLQAQQNQLQVEKDGGPSASARAQPARRAKSEARAAMAPVPAPPPSALPPASDISAFTDSPALRIAAATSPHLISAPGGKTQWRAGGAGRIEFSGDGGASWSRQASNVVAELTAGSAPSDKVCWIVGRGGTILLTTDAGTHWAILRSPLEDDWGGVRATDALHATIWNSLNTKSWMTSDGGATWTPASQ